jgi:hypothetical protein
MYFVVLISSSLESKVEIIGTASDILSIYKLIQKQTGAYFRYLHEYSEELYTDFGGYSNGDFSGKCDLNKLFKTYPELKEQYDDYKAKISKEPAQSYPYGDTMMKELEIKHTMMKKQKPIYYDRFDYEYVGSYVLSKSQELELINNYYHRKINPMCKALISIFKSPNNNIPISEMTQFIDKEMYDSDYYYHELGFEVVDEKNEQALEECYKQELQEYEEMKRKEEKQKATEQS